MMVLCNANDIIEYDRRTSELYNAAHHITQDANSVA
jgi:hypothetical protein